MNITITNGAQVAQLHLLTTREGSVLDSGEVERYLPHIKDYIYDPAAGAYVVKSIAGFTLKAYDWAMYRFEEERKETDMEKGIKRSVSLRPVSNYTVMVKGGSRDGHIVCRTLRLNEAKKEAIAYMQDLAENGERAIIIGPEGEPIPLRGGRGGKGVQRKD